MSTQSIKQSTFDDLQINVDKALACIGKRFILEENFGVKSNLQKKDLFLIPYYKRFLNQRYCKEEITENVIDKINKTINKYT